MLRVRRGFGGMEAMKTSLCLAVSLALLTGLTTVRAADGKVLYAANCVKCHGDDGKGHTKLGKKLEIRDFTQSAVWDSFDDEDAFKAVKNGIKRNGELVMGYKLPDEDIKAMIDYMRTMKQQPAAAPVPADTATTNAVQP
jgi:mono/diheme cytochrome c family protein